MPYTDRTVAIPAGAGTTVIQPAAGRLRSVLVTAAGTGSGNVVFYDEVQAAGTAIGQLPATVAADAFYEFRMPAAIGITVVNPANGPAMTVDFS